MTVQYNKYYFQTYKVLQFTTSRKDNSNFSEMKWINFTTLFFRIQWLNECGILEKLAEDVLPKNKCTKDKNSSSSLSIYALQGIFIVLAAAMPFCFLILVVEIIHSKIKRAKVVPKQQLETERTVDLSVKPITSAGSPMDVISENSVLTEVIE